MQPRPDPDPNDPWQILRLKAKILYDDVVRARQELIETRGDRRRIATWNRGSGRRRGRSRCQKRFTSPKRAIRFPVAPPEVAAPLGKRTGGPSEAPH